MAHINEYDIQLLCSQQSALVYSQNRDFLLQPLAYASMAQFKKYLNLPCCQEFTWIFLQAYFPFFVSYTIFYDFFLLLSLRYAVFHFTFFSMWLCGSFHFPHLSFMHFYLSQFFTFFTSLSLILVLWRIIPQVFR